MDKFSHIGGRLRIERERLGLSQTDFAAIADVTRKTLFSWETGNTAPDAFQLTVLATYGVDTMYILTGQRSIPVTETLNDKEASLLDSYRHAEPHQRRFIDDAVAMATGSLAKKVA